VLCEHILRDFLLACPPHLPQGPKNWAFFRPGSKSLGTHWDSFEAKLSPWVGPLDWTLAS
jgi:hypothetical protein